MRVQVGVALLAGQSLSSLRALAAPAKLPTYPALASICPKAPFRFGGTWCHMAWNFCCILFVQCSLVGAACQLRASFSTLGEILPALTWRGGWEGAWAGPQ